MYKKGCLAMGAALLLNLQMNQDQKFEGAIGLIGFCSKITWELITNEVITGLHEIVIACICGIAAAAGAWIWKQIEKEWL